MQLAGKASREHHADQRAASPERHRHRRTCAADLAHRREGQPGRRRLSQHAFPRDQLMAEVTSPQTRFRSLELSISAAPAAGNDQHARLVARRHPAAGRGQSEDRLQPPLRRGAGRHRRAAPPARTAATACSTSCSTTRARCAANSAATTARKLDEYLHCRPRSGGPHRAARLLAQRAEAEARPAVTGALSRAMSRSPRPANTTARCTTSSCSRCART